MTLEMRIICEKCEHPLRVDDDACICANERAFCPDCATEMNHIHPDYGGELVMRPKKKF